jgi:hypothetical protein
MDGSPTDSCLGIRKVIAISVMAALFAASVFTYVVAGQEIDELDNQGVPAPNSNETAGITNLSEYVDYVSKLNASSPGAPDPLSISNITFNQAYRPLKILWYDNYEEDNFAGSIREYLVSKGHTVFYTPDEDWGVNLNVMTSFPGYDVIVAEHTCGDWTLTGLQQWFQAGKGYVALLNDEMYLDPQDSYIRTLLGVNTDGYSTVGWNPATLAWTIPIHQIRTFPNSGWTLAGLVTSQDRAYVSIIGGVTVVNDVGGAVLQVRESVEGAGRIAYWGGNFHDATRTDPDVRQFVENMIVWAAEGSAAGIVEQEDERAPVSFVQEPKGIQPWVLWVVFIVAEVMLVSVLLAIVPGRRREKKSQPPAQPPKQSVVQQPPPPPAQPPQQGSGPPSG